MAQTVGQHGVAAFTSPINGDPLNATVVVANDNSTRGAYVDHDNDTGIHVQSSLLAARPAAGTAGRKWMTTDVSSVKLWFDTGAAWEEIAYLPSAGGTVAGNVSITGTLGVTGLITATGGVSGALTGNVTGNVTGTVSGNAGTATTLQTARDINGVSFNGSANITVTAAAGTLSGATLASGVTASSLTSVGTLSALAMGDNVISRPRFTDYAETYTTPTISAGTLTLNLENGNVFRVSRNANITTVTISNPPASGNAGSFTLIFDANGTSYTTTWPAAVKWPSGIAPTITTTSGRSDVFVFYTNNAGTTWYAMTSGQDFVTA